MMLKDKTLLKERPASAIVAVGDLARARGFYADTLGLDATAEYDEGVLMFRTGDTELVIYESESAGTYRAKEVVWKAGEDFDVIADHLRERGVAFDDYPDLGMNIVDGVHLFGDFKGVWFKDPDGNILHVANT